MPGEVTFTARGLMTVVTTVFVEWPLSKEIAESKRYLDGENRRASLRCASEIQSYVRPKRLQQETVRQC